MKETVMKNRKPMLNVTITAIISVLLSIVSMFVDFRTPVVKLGILFVGILMLVICIRSFFKMIDTL